MRKVISWSILWMSLHVSLVILFFSSAVSVSAQCSSGNAVYFDGNPIGRFIAPVVPSNSIGDNFTIEFWANPTGTITPGMIPSTSGFAGVSGQRYAVFPDWYNNTTQAGVGVSVGTNGIAVIEHAAGYMPATLVHYTTISGWTHIAVVYVNRVPSLYINGDLINPSNGKVQTGRALYPSSNVGNFIVGGFGFHLYGPYMGYIDDFRIWGASLSQNTIADWYNRELTAGHPNWGSIERYWNFNESSGPNAWDASGHGRYGTLFNDPVRDIPAAAFHSYTFYADIDADGFGDINNPVVVCASSPPANAVINSIDCNDLDASAHPGQIWYIDADGDHYGTGLNYTQCERPEHGYLASELTSLTGDCDDADATFHECPSNKNGLYALTYGDQGTISKYDYNTNTLTSSHRFTNDGLYASYGNQMVLCADGKYYGTMREGGKGFGLIYSFDPSTLNYSILKEFNMDDGSIPCGKLLLRSDGKLYGMTGSGGLNNKGLIFSFDPANSFYTILKAFDGVNGAFPYGNLTEGTDGKLYGMTSSGGITGWGVIFSFDINTSTLIKLKDFDMSNTGGLPYGSLTFASNGKFYGMTNWGGLNSAGTIFFFDPATNLFGKLIDFNSSTGHHPYGSLVLASNDMLYGMTSSGGANDVGTIFSIDPFTSTFSKLKDLHNTTGSSPLGSLTQGTDEKLYGMTSSGGITGWGVIFSYDIASNVYTKLKDLDNNQTCYLPQGTLVQHPSGKWFGTTAGGGTFYSGVIFSYDAITNSLVNLKHFGSLNGVYPVGSLMQASDKKLYGTTNSGGINSAGVIFSYDLSTSTYSKLKDFPESSYPWSKLIEVSDGKLYGTTMQGSNQVGTLFSFDRTSHELTTLFNFSHALGSQPSGGIIQGSDGKLYGMTCQGGAHGNGVIFSFDPLNLTYYKLKDFNGSDGAFPIGELIEINGILYGMTAGGGNENYGVIFSFNPTTSQYNILKYFDCINGCSGRGRLLKAKDGKLYGLAGGGGGENFGIIFSFDLSTSVYQNIKSFTGVDGSYPMGELIQAQDDKIYGMTYGGGLYDAGVVFSFDPATSIYTKLKDFNHRNGAHPYSGAAFLEITNFDCDPQNHIPTITASGPTSLCPGGSVTLTSSDADGYLWSTGETTKTITVQTSGNYSVTIHYGNNCSATSATTPVTVGDNEAPVVHTNNITIQLDNTGQASITPADINAGSSDNCLIPETGYTLDKTQFDCSDIGPNTVTLNVTDASGNSATGNAVVTVEDRLAPVVITQNLTIDLDQSGHASITPAQINNGSSDNCSINGYSLDKSSFSCDDLGMNMVTLTVTDVNGNSSTAVASVLVRDMIAPSVIAGSILGCYQNNLEAQNAAVQATQYSDNCTNTEVLQVAVTTAGTCNAFITVTIVDASNNSSSVVYNTRIDHEAPQLSSLPANKTINCDQTEPLPLISALDNCDGFVPVSFIETSTRGSDPQAGNYYNFIITRKWTAEDACGNKITHIQLITVHDFQAPVITTPALALDRAVDCDNVNGLQQALALSPIAQDNCAPTTIHLLTDEIIPGCGTGYIRKRTWNFTDPSGNTSNSFTQTITVADLIAPVITSNTANVQHCFVSLANNYAVPPINATDNCNTISYSYVVKNSLGLVTRTGSTNDASGSFDPGVNTIYWTVKDVCNNLSSATTTVSINSQITGSFSTLSVLPQGVSPDVLYLGYTPASSGSIFITVSGGTPAYTYSWTASNSGVNFIVAPASPNTINISAVQAGTTIFTVKIKDSKGCEHTFSKTITVKDVRCGNNLNKVLVCQLPPGNPQNANTNCINANAVAAVLNNGGYLGNCTNTNSLTSRQIIEQELINNEDLSIRIMPNPTSIHYSIVYDNKNGETIGLRIFNAVGQVIYKKENIPAGTRFTIGAEYFPGIYIAEFFREKTIKTFKLIKLPTH